MNYRTRATSLSLIALALCACPGRNQLDATAPADVVNEQDVTSDLGVADDVGVVDATVSDGAPPTMVSELPVNTTLSLPGLTQPVDVVVDRFGWSHIRGQSLEDVSFAQGYVTARDRMPQMELLRRRASGTLAEAFGGLSAELINEDIAVRAIGLRRVSERIWAMTEPGRVRRAFEAYTAGVNAYLRQIRAGERATPSGTELVVNDGTPDWTAVDSMVVGRLLALSQGYLAPEEIRATEVRNRLNEIYGDADGMTHPDRANRRGILQDFIRFQSESSTVVVPGFGARGRKPEDDAHMPGRVLAPAIDQHTMSSAMHFAQLVERSYAWLGGFARGSNNFVVHPSATTNGHAILENDPHMELPQPSLLYGIHLTVLGGPDAVDAAGVAIPGTPGILLGFNRRVSWGMTNSFYDGVDEYMEEIVPGVNGQPDGVRFRGGVVPLQTLTENIPNGTGGTVTVNYEVVPHHGVIVPEIAGGRIVPRRGTSAMSIRWTGHEPTFEAKTLFGFMYATNVNEAKLATRDWGAPPVSFVFADVEGHVAYSSQVIVPVRAPGARTFDPQNNLRGTLPCVVLPGDGSAEWTGTVAPELLPNADGSEATRFIVTANNDTAGNSRDNNPLNDNAYLGCRWAFGWRAERIEERLTALGNNVTRESAEAITADHTMLIGRRFMPFLRAAITRLEEEWTTPGTHADIAQTAIDLRPRQAQLRAAAAKLSTWTFDAASGVGDAVTPREHDDSVATAIFHVWMVGLLDLVFNDEMAEANLTLGGYFPGQVRAGSALFLLEHPMDAATRDPMTGESWLWDDLRTPRRERQAEMLLRALDGAVTRLPMLTRSENIEQWIWGQMHTIRFTSLVPGPGAVLSIPAPMDPMFPNGFPRPGGIEVVDAAEPNLADYNFTFGGGPAQRFTVEMDPAGPIAFNVIAGGTSIDRRSRHHRDEAELWRFNRSHRVPLLESDVVAFAESRSRLTP